VAHNAGLLRQDQELCLVLLATPGPVGYYAELPGGAGDGPPTFAMHTFRLPLARYRPLILEGARLVIPTTRHVPSVCVDPRVKQRSRLHWWLAEQEVRQADPRAAALLLDTEGHVTETASASFLVVRNGEVLSPPRSSVLEGISMQVVRELCEQLGVPFAERTLGVHDCLGADEALLASTPYCLAGVSQVNDTRLPFPGAMLRRLLAAWNAQVGLDLHGQILAAAH
jgi:branched-subunit amino acid aminotransferase/4-amino-4-deoxychorismate lyase